MQTHVLIVARPATGIQNHETRNSSKKTQKWPPGPRPQIPWKKLKKYQKYSKNSIFRVFLVFLVFFQGIWGRGPGGHFWVFFEEFRVSGFWIPVAGRATNASNRRGENASKRNQSRANADKRKQTLTPSFIAVF